IDGDLRFRGLTLVLAPGAAVPPDAYARTVGGIAGQGPGPGALAAADGPYRTPLLPAPEAGPVPDATACTMFTRELRAERRLVLIDCPAGFTTAWAQAAWAAGDQFVLVAQDDPRDLAALAPVAAGLTGAGAAVAVVANHARRRGGRARA